MLDSGQARMTRLLEVRKLAKAFYPEQEIFMSELFINSFGPRLAFDVGIYEQKRRAGKGNFEEFLLECGTYRNDGVEAQNYNEVASQITPLMWRKVWDDRGELRVVSDYSDQDVSTFWSWETPLYERESRGAMRLREGFATTHDATMAVQIKPPIEGMYDQGRIDVLFGEGEEAQLYGMALLETKDSCRDVALRLGEFSGDEFDYNDTEAIRAHGFVLSAKREEGLAILRQVLPGMESVWEAIATNSAESQFVQLQRDVDLRIAHEAWGMLEEGIEPDMVGVFIEEEYREFGFAIADVSGCGISNSMLYGENGGGFFDEEDISWWEAPVLWQKPTERWVNGVRQVKIEKCGFHWKNGGNCTWEPNDFVSVGSECPKCGQKFVCA